MGKLAILLPTPIAAVATNRGFNIANLLTPDPKEVWTDGGIGTGVIDIDLGAVVAIDTVFLGSIIGAGAAATWSISGGAAAYDTTVILAATALKAPDAVGVISPIAHAFWTGATQNIRYLRLQLSQPVDFAMTIGGVLAGKAFVATHGQEWGAGRKVIDTGSATALPSGGFAIVEGARKGSYSWTFGDLSTAEVDALYAIQLDRGETWPLLVVEDSDITAGLRWRLHYGRLTGLKQYERRDPKRTRWELSIEEWI